MTGRAKAGAQIHQGLVELPGPPGIEHQLTQLPEPSQRPRRRPGAPGKARQHPFDVAIEDGKGQVKGRREDAAGRTAANARQDQPTLQVPRPGLAQQLPGPLVQAPGPGVVAQPLPKQQHVVLAGGCQSLHGGEGRHPAPPVGQHHRQLGLLQHHLRHPNRVGIELLARGGRRACWRQLPGDLMAAMGLPPGQ